MPLKNGVENMTREGKRKYIKIVEEKKMEKEKPQESIDSVCVCVKVASSCLAAPSLYKL